MTACLLLRPGAIGDGLLAFPALHWLRLARPDLHVTLAAHPALAEVARRFGVCSRFISFDGPEVCALYTDDGGRLARERWPALDEAVVWSGAPPGALLTSLRALGVRSPVLAASQPPGPTQHVAFYLVATLNRLGVEPVASVDELSRAPLPRWVPRAPVAAGMKASRPRIVLHPGSGSARKNWPLASFLALASRLVEEQHAEVSLLVGPAEEALHAELASLGLPPAARLVSNLPLDAVADELLRHALYVGNDSGISHLAGLLGLPTLVLFGPTDPARWRPVGRAVHVLRAEPLASLSVELVSDAARGLLSETSA